MTPKSEMLNRAYSVKTSDDVRGLYRDWAQQYDQDLLGDDLQYVAPQMAASIFARYVTNFSARVLDVGCGTGLSGLALKDAGFTNLDGADLSQEMLEQARLKEVYQDLFEADIIAGMDLPDNSYDAALSVGTFTHGHVGPDALAEVLRVIKPTGVFCLTIHEGVYTALDYPNALQSLEDKGIAKVLTVEDADYIRGEDLTSKIACLGVL
ncbi:class I SAM-dependent methyltransferase [Thiohalocapsa marina]|uniref:Class I SAM-dependent methyltransferase n=1 Tax=Thiohalocapsa marina TaxID=424902 RepID=A0A5M8FC32_9GAMM|nr:class I SAM-dependent methyltransferase [Thiohalocapsa marina]KAA6182229.1 class I SAM-dependent methyltransferase [Thiohalocapsa marina]